jgi:hypothetical protein
MFWKKILNFSFHKNEERKLCLGTIKYGNIKSYLNKKKEKFEDWKMKSSKPRYRVIEGDDFVFSLKLMSKY